MGSHTWIVRLPEALSRRVRDFLAHGQHGYASLDELVEIALLNQLSAEGADRSRGQQRRSPEGGIAGDRVEVLAEAHARRNGTAAVLSRPAATPAVQLMLEPPASDEPLSVFTNRLSPIKVAGRVLANLSMSGQWPELESFRVAAANAARDLGRQLRSVERDEAASRRWVAFPIGLDEKKAKSRFVGSFTLSTTPDGAPTGPMVILGLANVVDGRVGLTRAGWRLAAAPSPLIDGSAGHTLSAPEAEILRAQLSSAPGERAAIDEFVDLVGRADGAQQRVDELLRKAHPQWSRDLAIAHRSAMLGRLGDLGALEVTGRGAQGRIRLLPAAEAFGSLSRSQVTSGEA